MPRFFMHILSNGICDRDEEGQVLPSIVAARLQALKGVGGLIADELALGRSEIEVTLLIEDEGRRPLLTIPVKVEASIMTDSSLPK